MSKFTGKSDFYDTVHMHYSVDEALKSDVYSYDGDKIRFEDEADILLYGPYLVGSMASSKNADGSSYLNIHLSKQSYIDEHEKDFLFWYYLTIKNLIQKSKQPLKDIDNPKFYMKYGIDLSKLILLKIYTYIATHHELKDLMAAYPIKKMSYNDQHWQIEKTISDKILEDVHLPSFNNHRLELLKEYRKLTNKLSLKAMQIQRQINDYDRMFAGFDGYHELERQSSLELDA